MNEQKNERFLLNEGYCPLLENFYFWEFPIQNHYFIFMTFCGTPISFVYLFLLSNEFITICSSTKEIRMSSKKKDSILFLCCFCGITIKSSRYNLDVHERLHGQYISRIRCAAKNCGSTFADKRTYGNHWAKFHSDIIMPDFLNYCDEPNQNKGAKRTSAAKTRTAKKDGAIENPINGERRESQSHRNEDGGDSTAKCEKPSELLNINIENAIQDCLLRDPFYGHLSALGNLCI